MAFNLVSEPSEVISVDGCVVFEMNQDTSGTSGVDIRTGAYRLTANSQQVTEIESLPFTGSNEKIEFTRELSPIVETTKPTIDSTTIFEDTSAVKTFYLDYGESVLDLSDCSNTITLSGQSNIINILNSRMQYYNRKDLTGSEPVILTQKPNRLITSPSHNDWINIYNYSGQVSVKTSFYDQDGLNGASAGSQTHDKNVYCWPIGLGNGYFNAFVSPPSGLQYYKVEIFNGTTSPGNLIKTYTFFLKDCEILDKYAEVYFVEPLGGISGIMFTNVTTQNNINSSLYSQPRTCGASTAIEASTKGRTRYDFSGFKLYNLTATLDYEEGLDLYLDAFLNAEEHYIRHDLEDGSSVMAKVNIRNGQYQTLNDEQILEFNITLEAHQGIKF